jgi:hypothetical protein
MEVELRRKEGNQVTLVLHLLCFIRVIFVWFYGAHDYVIVLTVVLVT